MSTNTEKLEARFYDMNYWYGCFRNGWKGMLSPLGFKHPAKFNYGVIERIFETLRSKKLINRGDLVFDPFGGVGCGGVIAAERGYRWIGYELEPKFVKIANENFALHKVRWGHEKKYLPEIINRDSRLILEHDKRPDLIVTSPPEGHDRGDDGKTEGNGAHGEVWRRGRDKASSYQGYGTARGQLTPNSVAAVASSPPYLDVSLNQAGDAETQAKRTKRMRKAGISQKRIDAVNNIKMVQEYGTTKEQLGNQGEDYFWSGAKIILEKCYKLLKPGGTAVWVTRNFIRDKQIVNFSDQWAKECRKVGFEPLEWCLAMNAIRWEEPSLLGGKMERSVTWKSFFRRLAEKHGLPKIDWDDVVFMTKPKE